MLIVLHVRFAPLEPLVVTGRNVYPVKTSISAMPELLHVRSALVEMSSVTITLSAMCAPSALTLSMERSATLVLLDSLPMQQVYLNALPVVRDMSPLLIILPATYVRLESTLVTERRACSVNMDSVRLVLLVAPSASRGRSLMAITLTA